MAHVHRELDKSRLAAVVWEGDSREVLQSFPDSVRRNLGFDLWRLQLGERPGDYRPLASIGSGVFELRDQDESGWYRVVYLSRTRDAIFVLHCFQKKSREMPRKEFETAKRRLRRVRERLARGRDETPRHK
jgi:phage-related protein